MKNKHFLLFSPYVASVREYLQPISFLNSLDTTRYNIVFPLASVFPHQSLFPFSGRHEVPSRKCVRFTGLFDSSTKLPSPNPTNHSSLQRETRGVISEAHWIYRTVTSPHPTTHYSPSAKNPGCHPCSTLDLRDCYLPVSISFTHDFPGMNDNMPLENSTHAVTN